DACEIVFRAGWVSAVAVGRFEEQHVGGGHGLWVAEDRAVVAPDVAREDQAHAVEREVHGRRAEDMPGAPQRGGHTARDRERVAVGARLREPQRRLGVGYAVQRERGAMLRIPAAVRSLRALFL